MYLFFVFHMQVSSSLVRDFFLSIPLNAQGSTAPPFPIESLELQACYFVWLLGGFLENQIWGLNFGEQVSLPTQLSHLLSILLHQESTFLLQNKSDREYVIVNT